jgi:hypothetical protein
MDQLPLLKTQTLEVARMPNVQQLPIVGLNHESDFIYRKSSFRLLLAESHLTRRLFAAMVRRTELLPLSAG